MRWLINHYEIRFPQSSAFKQLPEDAYFEVEDQVYRLNILVQACS